jgi:rhamnulokinase
MATMLAVDLGAQSGRVVLGRYDGERLTVSEVHRFPNVPVATRGVLHWDVLRLFGDILEGLRAAGVEGGSIDSVGVDSWGIDFALLDREGRLLQNPLHYRDRRRADAVEAALSIVPARELYERTGIQHLPINTIFELAALAAESDQMLEVADTFLLIPDLMHYWLGGRPVVERTNATTTQCWDVIERAWAFDLLERLEIPARPFPEIVGPGTDLGQLTDDIAESTGLAGAKVIAPATHDTGSAVAAVPFRNPRSAYISAGTWSCVGVELEHPVVDDRTFAFNITNEGGVGETFRLLRNVTGLWLLHESRRAWALDGHEFGFDELVSLAHDAPPLRSLIDPDDERFAPPGDMPRRIREFCLETEQEEPKEPAAVARCILESLALGHARVVKLLEEATGSEPEEIHVVGGGAQNELLCQWTSNAAGRPVLAGPVEAAAIGNLAVQAIALGELASIEEARDVIRTSFEPVAYEPEGTEEWEEAWDRFRRLGDSRSRAGVGS